MWGKITVQGKKGSPVTAITDNNGEINTDEILASEFGGEYFVEASLESNPSVKNKAELIMRIQGLTELIQGSSYELIGTPDQHLCQSTIPSSLHYANHFGEPKLIIAIMKIASEYYLLSDNKKIHVNDMSLEYGGKFDINNKWFGDHAEHKVGKNVDLAFKTSNNQNECFPVNKRILQELAVKFSDNRLKIHNDHYHMRIK